MNVGSIVSVALAGVVALVSYYIAVCCAIHRQAKPMRYMAQWGTSALLWGGGLLATEVIGYDGVGAIGVASTVFGLLWMFWLMKNPNVL